MRRLFVPGLGAPPAIYARALDERWQVLTPPSFAEGRGSLRPHISALVGELDAANEPATIAGHSMGAAVAVLATLERPEAVARLVLVSPAGLPLTKPVHASLGDFARQMRGGNYPLAATMAAAGSALRAPRASARLAHAVRSLDLSPELRRLHSLGIPCAVLGCTTDTLTPVEHCRQIAKLAGAHYRELASRGGHVWMLTNQALFASALA
jgi:pimeloyl-ACP methyl ester carboxylesterase